jgi:hypothetical protein
MSNHNFASRLFRKRSKNTVIQAKTTPEKPESEHHIRDSIGVAITLSSIADLTLGAISFFVNLITRDALTKLKNNWETIHHNNPAKKWLNSRLAYAMAFFLVVLGATGAAWGAYFVIEQIKTGISDEPEEKMELDKKRPLTPEEICKKYPYKC